MASHTAGLRSFSDFWFKLMKCTAACGKSSTRTSLRLRNAAIWSGPRSRAMSASPCSISRRWVAGSVTLRNNTLLSLGASVARLLASSTSTSLGRNIFSVNGPLPAELRFSQPLPRSPACSLAMTIFSSTMLPGRAASTLST